MFGARAKRRPRNLRNFWIELEVDGRKTMIETGPRHADGGFDLIIKVREGKGVHRHSLRVTGVVNIEGKLVLRATKFEGIYPKKSGVVIRGRR